MGGLVLEAGDAEDEVKSNRDSQDTTETNISTNDLYSTRSQLPPLSSMKLSLHHRVPVPTPAYALPPVHRHSKKNDNNSKIRKNHDDDVNSSDISLQHTLDGFRQGTLPPVLIGLMTSSKKTFISSSLCSICTKLASPFLTMYQYLNTILCKSKKKYERVLSSDTSSSPSSTPVTSSSTPPHHLDTQNNRHIYIASYAGLKNLLVSCSELPLPLLVAAAAMYGQYSAGLRGRGRRIRCENTNNNNNDDTDDANLTSTSTSASASASVSNTSFTSSLLPHPHSSLMLPPPSKNNTCTIPTESKKSIPTNFFLSSMSLSHNNTHTPPPLFIYQLALAWRAYKNNDHLEWIDSDPELAYLKPLLSNTNTNNDLEMGKLTYFPKSGKIHPLSLILSLPPSFLANLRSLPLSSPSLLLASGYHYISPLNPMKSPPRSLYTFAAHYSTAVWGYTYNEITTPIPEHSCDTDDCHCYTNNNTSSTSPSTSSSSSSLTKVSQLPPWARQPATLAPLPLLYTPTDDMCMHK
jgi:hypothetical protein